MSMICSKCGGTIMMTVHTVYRLDGGSSGDYVCQNCGARASWSVEGRGPNIIDMGEEE